MHNLNTGRRVDGSYFETVILSTLVKLVHNKIFPSIVVILFATIFYSFVLIISNNLFFNVAFIALSIPGFIGFAFYMYGLCDLAPNMYEAYKRFKREFTPTKSE